MKREFIQFNGEYNSYIVYSLGSIRNIVFNYVQYLNLINAYFGITMVE